MLRILRYRALPCAIVYAFSASYRDEATAPVMRLNLIARFAVHTRFRRIMYGCRKHRAETIRYRIKILKFNAACCNLSFALYTASSKSGFCAAKFKRIRAAFMFKFTLRFAIFGANRLQRRAALKRHIERIF